jgi:hypothetical protein
MLGRGKSRAKSSSRLVHNSESHGRAAEYQVVFLTFSPNNYKERFKSLPDRDSTIRQVAGMARIAERPSI